MYPSNPTDRSCVQLIERLMPRVKKCHSLRRWGLDISWTRPCSWPQCPRRVPTKARPIRCPGFRSGQYTQPTEASSAPPGTPAASSATPSDSPPRPNQSTRPTGGRAAPEAGGEAAERAAIPPIPPSRRPYPWPQVSPRSSPNPPPLARIPAPLSLAASPIALVSSRHRLGRAIRFPTSAVGSKCSGRVPGLSQRIRFYSVRGVRFLSAVAHSLGLSCRRFALRNCWVGGTVVSDTMYLHISHKEKQ
jgi:hypothetical protein